MLQARLNHLYADIVEETDFKLINEFINQNLKRRTVFDLEK